MDARKLREGDKRRDPVGTWFEVARAKTGRKAKATLSPRTTQLLEAYLSSLPVEPMGGVPIFCNRSGRPYSKDTLGDDFRDAPRCSVTTNGASLPISADRCVSGDDRRHRPGAACQQDGQHLVGIEQVA